MTWIDLGNPSPRAEPTEWQPVDWGPSVVESLSIPHRRCLPCFDRVVNSRRTQRLFGNLDRDQLGSFFWYSCRIAAIGSDSLGFPITQRPAPSAGAIHPIHVVVGDEHGGWSRYVPEDHALAEIEGPERFEGLCQKVRQVLDPQFGTMLLFVAEPGKTFSKYDHATSLVWRDAGILIGHMALVAESLSLNFCPLGITGEPWISELNEQGKLVGVGVALLGSRPAT